MSEKSFKNFRKEIIKNKNLKKEINVARRKFSSKKDLFLYEARNFVLNEVLPIAKKYGYDLTFGDFTKFYNQEEKFFQDRTIKDKKVFCKRNTYKYWVGLGLACFTLLFMENYIPKKFSESNRFFLSIQASAGKEGDKVSEKKKKRSASSAKYSPPPSPPFSPTQSFSSTSVLSARIAEEYDPEFKIVFAFSNEPFEEDVMESRQDLGLYDRKSGVSTPYLGANSLYHTRRFGRRTHFDVIETSGSHKPARANKVKKKRYTVDFGQYLSSSGQSEGTRLKIYSANFGYGQSGWCEAWKKKADEKFGNHSIEDLKIGAYGKRTIEFACQFSKLELQLHKPLKCTFSLAKPGDISCTSPTVFEFNLLEQNLLREVLGLKKIFVRVQRDVAFGISQRITRDFVFNVDFDFRNGLEHLPLEVVNEEGSLSDFEFSLESATGSMSFVDFGADSALVNQRDIDDGAVRPVSSQDTTSFVPDD
ncbi:MAG: hypothetical protein LBF33_01925, partial [Oscillospiraceae bacterium]|nr:hypothetical protein [Oscillospiraceae bacterium]